MLNIEQAMHEVSGVYQAVAGRPIVPGRSELPPEVDPTVHVEARFQQFRSLLDARMRAGGAPRASWAPPMDVLQTESETRYEFDLPGVSRDDVSVALIGDCLAIRGQRRLGRGADGRPVHQERSLGAFQKVAILPPRARRDAVEATMRDGVLTITVPTDGAHGDAREVSIVVK